MIYFWLIIISLALIFLLYSTFAVMESQKILNEQMVNLLKLLDQNAKLWKRIEAEIIKSKKKDSV